MSAAIARRTRAASLSEALRRVRDGQALVLAPPDGGGRYLTLTVVRSMTARMRGYLKRDADRGREGLLFPHTTSVHTAFMRFSLDVIHLSADGEVLAVAHAVPPFRLGPFARATRHIVELPSERVGAPWLKVGDKLVARPAQAGPGDDA